MLYTLVTVKSNEAENLTSQSISLIPDVTLISFYSSLINSYDLAHRHIELIFIK